MAYRHLQALARINGELSHLTIAQRFVLHHLALHASQEGALAWSSNARIAEHTGLSKRCVQYALQKLEADRLIDLFGKTNRGVRRFRLGFALLNPEQTPRESEKGCKPCTHGKTEGCSICTGGGAELVHPRGAKLVHPIVTERKVGAIPSLPTLSLGDTRASQGPGAPPRRGPRTPAKRSEKEDGGETAIPLGQFLEERRAAAGLEPLDVNYRPDQIELDCIGVARQVKEILVRKNSPAADKTISSLPRLVRARDLASLATLLQRHAERT